MRHVFMSQLYRKRFHAAMLSQPSATATRTGVLLLPRTREMYFSPEVGALVTQQPATPLPPLAVASDSAAVPDKWPKTSSAQESG